jgi:hypothetical protein
MCKSSSRTQCHCCKKNFCRSHFNEHDNLPNLQVNSLVDEVNLLNDRLMAFNGNELTGDSRQKLERWRTNCHKLIDDIFEEKCRRIDQCVNEKMGRQRDEITKLRSTIVELIQKQEVTTNDIDLLKAAVHTVEEKMNNLGQICFGVVIHPLVIDESLIRIKELNIPYLNLSNLPLPYKRVNHIDGSSRIIAINDRFFLVHQEPNLCLMNRDFVGIKRRQWSHGPIWDMCWSSTLTRFVVVTQGNVFIVDDSTLSIQSIQINQNQRWFSCACSHSTLYLSTINAGSSIFEFNLSPSIQFKKQWTPPETCAQNQIIMNIVYKNKTLALTISDQLNKEKFIELRSSTTMERLWSLRLDIEYNNHMVRCCSLNHSDWLVLTGIKSRLLHISKDGKVQATSQYTENLVFVRLFDGNKLAISTEKELTFTNLC